MDAIETRITNLEKIANSIIHDLRDLSNRLDSNDRKEVKLYNDDGTYTEYGLINVLLSLVIITDKPDLPSKVGYIWKEHCDIQNGRIVVSWELVKDENYMIGNDGSDYLLAIPWYDGNSVEIGLWYDVGEQVIWQAIKSGIPNSAKDKEFFDIP